MTRPETAGKIISAEKYGGTRGRNQKTYFTKIGMTPVYCPPKVRHANWSDRAC